MPSEPSVKRTIAFIDGQNLFHAAKEAFGYSYPNYEVLALASAVCQAPGWKLEETRFYTGIPDASDNPVWNHFWTSKLLDMSRRGVRVFSRPLRYRNKTIKLPDGGQHSILVGDEKGVDIRIALEVIRLAHQGRYDVALIFTQDQDFSEVADEIRLIAQEQDRWIKIATAYPASPASRNRRGVDRTDWIRINKTMYDSCLDKKDHRPKTRPK